MEGASFAYRLVVWFFVLVRKIFFRDVIVRGSHKIPRKGPVIFVAAPHANQFVDPLILISTCPRPIGFLMAAVSLKRRIIGFFGRMLDSIPVERAQDHAKRCTGTISLAIDCADDCLISGEGTRFREQILPFLEQQQGEAALLVSHDRELFSALISHVIDDTHVVLKRPFDAKVSAQLRLGGLPFSVSPVIDQKDLYTAVFHQLRLGKCIGVFPEGGSHDRAEMLPLKAGVTIMALGYLSIYPEAQLTIIPCGLNYFNAHRFRSRAVVEYGEPIDVPSELVAMFKSGGDDKRHAISMLLKTVAQALQTVTVNVPDFETLQFVQAARRLYRPEDTLKRPDMQVELNRRFVKGYLKYKDDPRIVQLRQSIIEYNNLLLAFGIKDHQVKSTDIETLSSLCQLTYHLSVLLIFGLVSLPGFVINAPALYLIGSISKRKARAAKKASSVKIHGKDVISTWKLLVALVLLPAMYSMYSVLIVYYAFGSTGHMGYLLWVIVCWIMLNLLMLLSFLTVRLSELVLNSHHAIKPLLLAMMDPQRCLILRRVRASLREQINIVVNDIGPSIVENFDQNRIVKCAESGRTTPGPAIDGPFMHSNFSSSSILSGGELASGRASPVFDGNMETIESMLSQCRDSLAGKKKTE